MLFKSFHITFIQNLILFENPIKLKCIYTYVHTLFSKLDVMLYRFFFAFFKIFNICNTWNNCCFYVCMIHQYLFCSNYFYPCPYIYFKCKTRCSHTSGLLCVGENQSFIKTGTNYNIIVHVAIYKSILIDFSTFCILIHK